MKKGTKCDKCNTAEAEVYFSIVNGRGNASRKKYCKKCALLERIRTIPKFSNESVQDEIDPLDLVQQEMEKSYSKPLVKNKTKPSQIETLEKALSEAISKEDYEKAAHIRDQIAVIKNTHG
jgi:protein-arginine kinase activator protein McsA